MRGGCGLLRPMTIFTATALATLIAAQNCVPPQASPVLIGIAQTESALNSLAIHDNTANVSFTPSSDAEAISLAKALLGHGHDLDLGIGQINTRNLSWTGLTVEAAFDPCRNLAAASRILFVRYNGNPPVSQKAAYAQRVINNMRAIPDDSKPPPVGAFLLEDRPGPIGETLFLGDN
jgi:hypothetical protein